MRAVCSHTGLYRLYCRCPGCSPTVSPAILNAETDSGIVFLEPKEAFEAAIRAGRLSDAPKSPVYAGHFMYMGTQTASLRPVRQQKDLFKNIRTREYLP